MNLTTEHQSPFSSSFLSPPFSFLPILFNFGLLHPLYLLLYFPNGSFLNPSFLSYFLSKPPPVLFYFFPLPAFPFLSSLLPSLFFNNYFFPSLLLCSSSLTLFSAVQPDGPSPGRDWCGSGPSPSPSPGSGRDCSPFTSCLCPNCEQRASGGSDNFMLNTKTESCYTFLQRKQFCILQSIWLSKRVWKFLHK